MGGVRPCMCEHGVLADWLARQDEDEDNRPTNQQSKIKNPHTHNTHPHHTRQRQITYRAYTHYTHIFHLPHMTKIHKTAHRRPPPACRSRDRRRARRRWRRGSGRRRRPRLVLSCPWGCGTGPRAGRIGGGGAVLLVVLAFFWGGRGGGEGVMYMGGHRHVLADGRRTAL